MEPASGARVCFPEESGSKARERPNFPEAGIPFALFEDDERLTRSFATEREVWDAAERAGLVVAAPNGTKILDDHLEIKPCDAVPDQTSDPGFDFLPS